MPIVAPSILAADFGNLDRDIRMVNDSDADWIHVDIMDGVFVPNISFGFPVLEAVKRVAAKPLDVHLMIVQPERFVEAFAKGGAGTITVHAEACPHLHRNIQQIKSFECKAGVALNPHTRIDELENVIFDIDLICVMSVNPGFGAQKFIEHTYQKIKDLKALIKKNNATAVIEIDGGVNLGNAKALVDAGADVLVAGNFVFTAGDPKSVIRELKEVK
jgi:ribulose-phosphate 3-epimerase